MPGDVNGERLSETSKFTWWIGQIFFGTLYLDSPLDLLLLASFRPATIFRFIIPLWPGVSLDHWHSRGWPWAGTDGVR